MRGKALTKFINQDVARALSMGGGGGGGGGEVKASKLPKTSVWNLMGFFLLEYISTIG
jgi:hypothetical protein